jgi:hypothetical protein
VNRSLGGQVRDEIVGDAVRDLVRLRSVRVEADDGPDDRADGLSAERGRAVHQHD